MIFSNLVCKVGLSPGNLWALWKLWDIKWQSIKHTMGFNKYPFYVLPFFSALLFLVPKMLYFTCTSTLLQTTSLFLKLPRLLMAWQRAPSQGFQNPLKTSSTWTWWDMIARPASMRFRGTDIHLQSGRLQWMMWLQASPKSLRAPVLSSTKCLGAYCFIFAHENKESFCPCLLLFLDDLLESSLKVSGLEELAKCPHFMSTCFVSGCMISLGPLKSQHFVYFLHYVNVETKTQRSKT